MCFMVNFYLKLTKDKMRDIDFGKIRLLVLDVDGVLSDGCICMTSEGVEMKSFSVKDGSGLKYWQRAGGKIAWITGRESPLVSARAEELGVDVIRQGCKTKLPVYEEVLASFNAAPQEVAVLGDDLPDLPMLLRCGLAATPADGVEELRQRVDYICKTPGGRGCVRELVELILKKSGRWEQIMTRYL